MIGRFLQQDTDGGSYVHEYYEKNREFLDILMEHVDIFDAEDKAWLLRLWSHKGEEDFDAYLQVQGLREAFHTVPSGFRVGQHACKLVEDDKQPLIPQP